MMAQFVGRETIYKYVNVLKNSIVVLNLKVYNSIFSSVRFGHPSEKFLVKKAFLDFSLA